MYAGTTQALADQSLAVMDALSAPFEAAWPKQLSVSNPLKSPLATRVPLPASTYHSVGHLHPDNEDYCLCAFVGYLGESRADSMANRCSY